MAEGLILSDPGGLMIMGWFKKRLQQKLDLVYSNLLLLQLLLL
jgi:hypothetical protein